MSYPNDTNVVFQYLLLILLKIVPFESSIEKEKYFHYHIFITGMCKTRGSISVPISSTKLLMVFDCEDQLSFDFYAIALPLKRLYKGMLFQITEQEDESLPLKILKLTRRHMCLRSCMCACVRVCMCVRACVCACVCVCVIS